MCISQSYDNYCARTWDSMCAPEIFKCCVCEGYIPEVLASFTELNNYSVFCSTFCKEEWTAENSWQYE